MSDLRSSKCKICKHDGDQDFVGTTCEYCIRNINNIDEFEDKEVDVCDKKDLVNKV